jgi:hypothetical protein
MLWKLGKTLKKTIFGPKVFKTLVSIFFPCRDGISVDWLTPLIVRFSERHYLMSFLFQWETNVLAWHRTVVLLDQPLTVIGLCIGIRLSERRRNDLPYSYRYRTYTEIVSRQFLCSVDGSTHSIKQCNHWTITRILEKQSDRNRVYFVLS